VRTLAQLPHGLGILVTVGGFGGEPGPEVAWLFRVVCIETLL
jgi:hypothetical protein